MKPFLCIDITENKKNEKCNGDELIVARPSAAQAQALDRAGDEYIDIIGKTVKPPLKLRIPLIITGVLSVLSLIVLSAAFEVSTEDDIPLGDMFARVPWLFMLCAAVIAVFIILSVVNHKRAKSLLESEETENVNGRLDNIVGNIFSEFGLPADAVDIDILSFSYKMKNGEPVIKKDSDSITDCSNDAYKAYTADGNLYFVCAEAKYAFPLDSLKSIRTVDKKISMFGWNKDEEFNKGIYKPYKIKEDDGFGLIIKKYHILEAEINGEKWGIYFPPYELTAVEQLTGIS